MILLLTSIITKLSGLDIDCSCFRLIYWLRISHPTTAIVPQPLQRYLCSCFCQSLPRGVFCLSLSLFLSQLEVNTSFMVAPVFFILATVSSGTSTTRLHLTLTSNFRAGGFDPAALGVRPGPQKGLFSKYISSHGFGRGGCVTPLWRWDEIKKCFIFSPWLEGGVGRGGEGYYRVSNSFINRTTANIGCRWHFIFLQPFDTLTPEDHRVTPWGQYVKIKSQNFSILKTVLQPVLYNFLIRRSPEALQGCS